MQEKWVGYFKDLNLCPTESRRKGFQMSIIKQSFGKTKDGQKATLYTIENKNVVVPKTSDISAEGNVLKTTVPAKTFAVFRF